MLIKTRKKNKKDCSCDFHVDSFIDDNDYNVCCV